MMMSNLVLDYHTMIDIHLPEHHRGTTTFSVCKETDSATYKTLMDMTG